MQIRFHQKESKYFYTNCEYWYNIININECKIIFFSIPYKRSRETILNAGLGILCGSPEEEGSKLFIKTISGGRGTLFF